MTDTLDAITRCYMGLINDSPIYFENLFAKVCETATSPVIFVGDWNLVLDLDKDAQFYRTVGNPRARDIVLNAMVNENLVDIWREQHVNVSRFTWRRSNPLRLSRLDFFLVSADLVHSISTTDIMCGYRTDHNIVTMTLKKLERPGRKLYWKFNNSLLDDEDYINVVKKVITSNKYVWSDAILLAPERR